MIPWSPKASQNGAQILPQDTGNSNFRKTANLTKTIVFTMFRTHPHIASWCHVHAQIIRKTILRIRTAIQWSILRTSRRNDSKVGPKGLPKCINENIKIYVWPPRCPVGGPWGPQDLFFGYPSTTRCSAASSVRWTKPEGQTGPRKFTCRSTPTAPAELGGAMTSSPPTRAKSPHAAEGPRLPNPGNSRSTPYHDGCRPQSWWLRHDDRGP